MHVAVQVRSGSPVDFRGELATQALTVMVAVDDQRRPVVAPTWKPSTDEDRRLWRHARELIGLRESIGGLGPVPV